MGNAPYSSELDGPRFEATCMRLDWTPGSFRRVGIAAGLGSFSVMVRLKSSSSRGLPEDPRITADHPLDRRDTSTSRLVPRLNAILLDQRIKPSVHLPGVAGSDDSKLNAYV